MKLLICYGCRLRKNHPPTIVKEGEAPAPQPVIGFDAGDMIAEVPALTEEALEAVKLKARKEIIKKFQGNNGIIVDMPFFHSVTKLEG